jgi:cytochrome c biogenesis protein CcdA/thiol-disulfide isomerase/thioredoxin
MIVLVLFAVLAGAGTALSPCVLPVLPALLSAGATGGRRRPLGIVAGLTVTFTVTIVGIARVVDGVGLGADPLRYLAVVTLAIFGAVLLVPTVAQRIEARLSRVAALGPRGRGDGFMSGLVVGGALGFVYTPCAGPILAAVISVSAATSSTIVVGVGYALGSAVVLLLLTLGGRRVLDRARRAGRGPALQRVLGGVMVLTAVAIVTQLDVSFDQFVARSLPDINLTASLEGSHAVTSRLTRLHGPARFAPNTTPAVRLPAGAGAGLAGVSAPPLPRLGRAPEFVGNDRWFNTPGGSPLTLASLRGRVVLVDFWTYTCINCIRTLPYLEAWDSRYRPVGLTVIGIHSPEFSFEHDAGNVANSISKLGIRYPVAQDNTLATWNAYGNQYWPAEYLIDAQGQVRRAHFGEGDYDQSEAAIRALLAEAGHRRLGDPARPRGVLLPSAQTTPETYMGAARAQGFVRAPTTGRQQFGPTPPRLDLNQFAFSGTWQIADESATAQAGASLDAEVQSKDIYLVLGPRPGGGGHVQVALDGRPVPSWRAGADVHGSAVTVTGQRLYRLVALRRVERHRLTLSFDPGVSGYAFTFG